MGFYIHQNTLVWLASSCRGWIAGWLMALLQEYQASGVTRTIALAEIELKLEDMINQRTRGIAGSEFIRLVAGMKDDLIRS